MAMRRDNEVTVRTTIEIEVSVVCRVTPETPSRGPDFNCAGGYPGDPGEVEILSMESDGGTDLSRLVDELSRGDVLAIEELAQESVSGPDDGPYDTLEEARGER